MRFLLSLCIAVSLSSAATVKDLCPPLFSGLSKIYNGVPFRSRLDVKALDMKLRTMADAADVDLRALASKYDSAGFIPSHKQVAYYNEVHAYEKTVLPPVKAVEVRLTVPRIDSLHLTLDEDRALTPFVTIVADTTR